MTVLWPLFLLLLGLVPLLIALYIWMLRRRRRFTVRYSSLSLVRVAAPPSNRRRHIPFALFLLGLTSLVGATSRPVSIVSVPTNQTSIILAMDVSGSMCSTDINPNRLTVAKEAALNFIRRQKPGTRIGLVAFSGYAELIQPPTTNADALQAAVDNLMVGRRTAVGSGILKSIDAIAEIDQSVAPSITSTSTAVKPTPVPKGAYVPDIIVLLTDGASNAGPSPVDAAQQAVDRGIRVYTIGFGTERGSEFPNCGNIQGTEPLFGGQGGPGGGGPPGGGGRGFGGGGFGGFRRGIDEETLKKVSAMTDAKYYSAESADQLEEVFQNLPTSLIMKHETTELTFVFTTLAGVLAALAIILSLLWNPLS